jgi:hypothetical protein
MRGWHRFGQGFGRRYAAVTLGSGLLLFAGDSARVMLLAPISPLRGLLTALASALGLICLGIAGLPSRETHREDTELHEDKRAIVFLLLRDLRALPVSSVNVVPVVLAGVLAVFAFLVFVGSVYATFSVPPARAYTSDVVAFDYVNARDVAAGLDPYLSDATFRAVLAAYPLAAPTPLRRGLFSGGEDYPRSARFVTVEGRWLADPSADRGEFDPATLHSYPALSFLIYVPLVWAGVSNVLWLDVLACAALLCWLIWLAPAGQRGWAALALGTAAIIPRHSLLLDSEVYCVALLLAAWHWRERRLAGSALLGLACAFKQYCWFFAPFFLVDMVKTQGWREATRRGAIALGTFLLPNLPFLLASPRAWLTSQLVPMRDPMFPSGIGAVAVSMGHLLPYPPTGVYAALEALALLTTLWLYAHQHAGLRELALLLALVPLWFAFRSPPNYFAFAPWLAVYAAHATAKVFPASPPTCSADDRTQPASSSMIALA